MPALLAEVTRGPLLESMHYGVVVVADITGQVIAHVGDPAHVAYFRSCAKPFQTMPPGGERSGGCFQSHSIRSRDLLCVPQCNTRTSSPFAGILTKIGLDDTALHCGFTPPFDEQEAARIALELKPKSPVECECSGEHVGMLVTCVHESYPLETYTEATHPLQRRRP